MGGWPLTPRGGWPAAKGATRTAPMLRDVERNAPIEADHIIGDLLRREKEGRTHGQPSHLSVAYTHLKAYEARRERMLPT